MSGASSNPLTTPFPPWAMAFALALALALGSHTCLHGGIPEASFVSTYAAMRDEICFGAQTETDPALTPDSCHRLSQWHSHLPGWEALGLRAANPAIILKSISISKY